MIRTPVRKSFRLLFGPVVRLLLLLCLLAGLWGWWATATPRPAMSTAVPWEDSMNAFLSQDASTLAVSGAKVTERTATSISHTWSTPVRLFDTATGRERLRILDERVPLGGLHMAPDGSWLLVQEGAGRLTLWDAATGRQRAVLRPTGESGLAGPLVVSPDGRLIAHARPDGKAVELWEGPTGRPTLTLAGARWPFTFTPDGGGLVAAAAGGTEARMWDTATGRERLVFGGHRTPVASVCVSQDGRRIATGLHWATMPERGVPTDVKVWDAHTGAELATIDLPNPPKAFYSLELSPDGTVLAIHSDMSHGLVWDVSGATPVCRDDWLGASPSLQSGVVFAFGPDGRLVRPGESGGTLTVASTPDGTPRATLRLPGSGGTVRESRFADDGNTFAVAVDYSVTGFTKLVREWMARLRLRNDLLHPYVVQVFDLATGRLRATLPECVGGYRIIGLSPDGRSLWTMRPQPAVPPQQGVNVIERWEVPPPGPPAWLPAVTVLGVLLAAADLARSRRRRAGLSADAAAGYAAAQGGVAP